LHLIITVDPDFILLQL